MAMKLLIEMWMEMSFVKVILTNGLLEVDRMSFSEAEKVKA